MPLFRVPEGWRHEASDMRAFLALHVEHALGGVLAAELAHPGDGVAKRRSCAAVIPSTPFKH